MWTPFRSQEKPEHFRFKLFISLTVAQTLAGLWLVIYLVSLRWPDVARAQLSVGLFAVWLLIIHLFMSGVEWNFHRYALHKVVLKWLASMRRSHEHHHGHTYVLMEAASGVVENKYPITEEDQVESSAFPPYALVAFWLIFSPLLAGLQYWLPSQPILSAGCVAIACSVGLYEVKHAMEHLSYPDFWEPRLKRYPWLVKIYSIHLYHHVNKKMNMAIGGFLGFPIWDWLLGTLVTTSDPEQLPLDGKNQSALLPVAWPTPRRSIVWLDMITDKLHSRVQGKIAGRALKKSVANNTLTKTGPVS